MTWQDVPGDYEVMGYADASPDGLASIEDAQKKVEQMARQKGADAIVLEGVERRLTSPPVLETKETHEKNANGGYTKKTTTTENVQMLETLKVTFIKYK